MSVSAIRMAPRPTGYDPAADARARVAAAKVNLADVTLMTNQMLIIGHKLPERTAGGIILSDKTKDEDRWQGKVGLVLAMGPTCFKDDGINQFGGSRAEVGDWVVTRAMDGHEIKLGNRSEGVICKIIRDTHVEMVVKDPDQVF